MSIYVDFPTEYPSGMIAISACKYKTRIWSHLWCDPGDEENLHQLAKKIGLRRKWYQDKTIFKHYDLTRSKRLLAIKAGAEVKDFADWCKEKRKGKDTEI